MGKQDFIPYIIALLLEYIIWNKQWQLSHDELNIRQIILLWLNQKKKSFVLRNNEMVVFYATSASETDIDDRVKPRPEQKTGG